MKRRDGLTLKQAKFVKEYRKDGNATQAAIRAGYSKRSASAIADRNMRNAVIALALKEQTAAVLDKLEITAEAVARRFAEIGMADVNELVQYRRGCCRHCWGADFGYQWTEREFAMESAQAERLADEKGHGDDPILPSIAGGFGFDPNRAPNKECPQCQGDGHGRAYVADTRRVSAGARALYAGVKVSKDGAIEVKLHSQLDALEKLGRHLGMFEKDNAQRGTAAGKTIAEWIANVHKTKAGRLRPAP